MAISHLIIVRFEKFKIWHAQESKPVLQDILDPIYVCPNIFFIWLGREDGHYLEHWSIVLHLTLNVGSLFQIIKKYDIVMVQEIRDSKQIYIYQLQDLVNK